MTETKRSSPAAQQPAPKTLVEISRMQSFNLNRKSLQLTNTHGKRSVQETVQADGR